jgi:hypothetical protein
VRIPDNYGRRGTSNQGHIRCHRVLPFA